MAALIDKAAIPAPLVFAPQHQSPQQLFILLHGNNADPAQLEALQKAVAQAFPASLIVLPFAPLCADSTKRHWFEQDGLTPDNYVPRIQQALPSLMHLVQHLQAEYALPGEATALAGFGQGATIALEACSAQPDLAGRVLAFSGPYACLPASAPATTTVHLLHGENDATIPLSFMRETHSHLAQLQGDATLDIASGVAHELHDVLIGQGIHRLQTYVPLRSWQNALGDLDEQAGDVSSDSLPDGDGPVLH